MVTSAQPAPYARTSATLGGQYRKFFGASVAAALLLQVTIVTDTIIVGQLLGPVPMSGVRVASPIVNILNVLAMLVGVGGSTVAAIAIGRRDGEAANRAFTLSIVCAIVLGLAFALLVVPFADSLANLISSDKATAPYTATFLRIVSAASPVYILASVMALLLRTDSCIRLSSVVLVVAGIANVAFDLLFMGMVKTMIRDSLATGESPAAALNKVNDHLCKSNPEGMFVTVFAALFDPVTGIVRFANAGHMPPLLVNDGARVLEMEPGVLLGLFDDAGLENDTVQLSRGEALLVYTDGVTEAVNPGNEFFGEERLIAAMQKHAPYAAARALVDETVNAVEEFVEQREQFDDLTLLAIMRTSELAELPVETASFSTMREGIMATGFDEDLKLKACLVCEEVLVNIVSYSKANHVWFESVEDGGSLRIVLADDGVLFDPTNVVIADKEFEDLESGGMGIGLVRKLASGLHYRREAGLNILVARFAPK